MALAAAAVRKCSIERVKLLKTSARVSSQQSDTLLETGRKTGKKKFGDRCVRVNWGKGLIHLVRKKGGRAVVDAIEFLEKKRFHQPERRRSFRMLNVSLQMVTRPLVHLNATKVFLSWANPGRFYVLALLCTCSSPFVQYEVHKYEARLLLAPKCSQKESRP